MRTVERESLLVCPSVQAGQAVIDHLFGKGLVKKVETMMSGAQNATDDIKYILHYSEQDAAVIAGEISAILHPERFTFTSL